MSDSKNKLIQDRGWDNMHSILDKELPVEKKRRRFAFWLPFGGAIIAIIALATLMYFPSLKTNSNDAYTDNINETYSESTKKEKNAIENNSTDNYTNAKESRSGDDNVTINREENLNTKVSGKKNVNQGIEGNVNSVEVKPRINKIASTSPSINEQSRPRSKQNVSLIDNESKEILIDGNDLVVPIGQAKSVIKESKPKIEFKQITTEFIDNKIELTKGKNKILGPIEQNNLDRYELQSVFKLPLIIPSLLKVNEPIGDTPKPIIALNNNNLFSPYLFAGANYQSNIRGLGYGIGGGLSYGNSNFEGYIEAGYYRSRYNSGVLPNDFVPDGDVNVFPDGLNNFEQADGSEIEIVNSSSEFDVNVSNFSDLTTNTEELKIDFGLRKRLFKRLNLDFGIAYASLLNANNKALLISVETEIPGVFTEIEKNTYNINSSELINTGAYSKYDVIPHIGIEYSFGSHIHLGLHYQHGLKNLIANTDLERLNSLSASNDVIYRRNLSAKIRVSF